MHPDEINRKNLTQIGIHRNQRNACLSRKRLKHFVALREQPSCIFGSAMTVRADIVKKEMRDPMGRRTLLNKVVDHCSEGIDAPRKACGDTASSRPVAH